MSMVIDSPLMQGVVRIRAAGPLHGRIRVPGDKSISHRSIMMASLAEGTSQIHGFLESEDCMSTLSAFRAMGIDTIRVDDTLKIKGNGVDGLYEPHDVINMGNSGTGTRLLMGILAGQRFAATLTGDSSLRSRPMRRVVDPLRDMGAQFLGREGGNKLPLTVQGGWLKAIEYDTPVASAQIKSALLLAGLFADGVTVIREPGPSRDHTELMLKTFGVEIDCELYTYSLRGRQTLQAREITIPGDISSAAFFIVAASIVPDSDLTLEGVGLNPTRTGILDVLQQMGANIEIQPHNDCGAEPTGDIRVQYSPLNGIHVSGETVVRMIDEFPIFAVAASFASSSSVVEGAEELRVKESDRIAAIVKELGCMGVQMREHADGFEVQGNNSLRGAMCNSYGDHRIAMSIAVAALAASGETEVRGTAPVATSFPSFFELLQQICPGSVTQIS